MSGFQHGRTLEPVGWLIAPVAGCILASLILAMPLRLWGFRLPEPVFAFIPAFAWAVVRPSVIGPVLLFVLGFFLDLLWGSPLGLWSAALITSYGFVTATRPFMTGQARLIIFGWYVAACLIGFGGAYLMTMLKAFTTLNLFAFFWQFGVTIALYPLAHMLIERFEDADVRFR
jgi:rod shape-determining protein MreD